MVGAPLGSEESSSPTSTATEPSKASSKSRSAAALPEASSGGGGESPTLRDSAGSNSHELGLLRAVPPPSPRTERDAAIMGEGAAKNELYAPRRQQASISMTKAELEQGLGLTVCVSLFGKVLRASNGR